MYVTQFSLLKIGINNLFMITFWTVLFNPVKDRCGFLRLKFLFFVVLTLYEIKYIFFYIKLQLYFSKIICVFCSVGIQISSIICMFGRGPVTVRKTHFRSLNNSSVWLLSGNGKATRIATYCLFMEQAMFNSSCWYTFVYIFLFNTPSLV